MNGGEWFKQSKADDDWDTWAPDGVSYVRLDSGQPKRLRFLEQKPTRVVNNFGKRIWRINVVDLVDQRERVFDMSDRAAQAIRAVCGNTFGDKTIEIQMIGRGFNTGYKVVLEQTVLD